MLHEAYIYTVNEAAVDPAPSLAYLPPAAAVRDRDSDVPDRSPATKAKASVVAVPGGPVVSPDAVEPAADPLLLIYNQHRQQRQQLRQNHRQ